MYEEIIRPLVKIVEAASTAILEIYHRAGDIEIEKKGDDSPLTLADRKANEIIVAGLEQLPFQFPIISEENKLVAYEERKNYEYYWLVDPLDGTKEFIKRNGEFTVNIALVKKDRPVFGIISVPVQNKVYYGIKGQGAFWVENGTTTRLQANSYKMTDKGLRVVTSRSHMNEATANFVHQMNEPQFVSMGSSLKFMALAEGKADVYPRYGLCMEWDTGAAQIILEEAGGSVLQVDTNEPLVYNKENLLNPFFIANGKVNLMDNHHLR
jgi:3'(2'), 5'-bisphosphate nucleotidase